MCSQSFQYTLDSVFNESHKQEKFYVASVRPLVKSFVEGENACILLFGPTESGKTHTLKGKTGMERGILPRAVEDIFNIVKNSEEREEDFEIFKSEVLSTSAFDYPTHDYPAHSSYRRGDQGVAERMFLKVCVYQIFVDKVIDLLQGAGQTVKISNKVQVDHYIDKESEEVVSRLKNITEKVVFTLEDFYSVLQEAFKNRRIESVSMQEQDLRKKSHFIISLTLMRRTPQKKLQELSHLNFVELSGSEQAVAEEKFFMDSSVKQFVTKSFNSLSAQMLRAALKKRMNPAMEDGDSKVVNCLRNTLTTTSNILMVCCVNPGESYFEHSLPALKFCARIRDCIMKKLQQRSKNQPLPSHSATLDEVDYNQESARTGGTVSADGMRDQISRIKDQLIDKQMQLNSQQINRNDLESWAKDQIRNVDKLTQKLRGENLNGSRERANYIVLDDLQQLKEHLSKINSRQNTGKNYSQGSFGMSSGHDPLGTAPRTTRNEPRAYDPVKPDIYNPFSTGTKGYYPFSSQVTPASPGVWDYPPSDSKYPPQPYRSNHQSDPSSLEKRDYGQFGQSHGPAISQREFGEPRNPGPWDKPMNFESQSPNFYGQQYQREQQRDSDNFRDQPMRITPRKLGGEIGRDRQRDKPRQYQGGAQNHFSTQNEEPITIDTIFDSQTNFPSQKSMQNRTSNIRRPDTDQIFVYPQEESKVQGSPQKSEGGYRMTKQQTKLMGGNTLTGPTNVKPNDTFNSNAAENDFLNKANPILDVSLTGERNNISTVVQENGSTKVSVEPKGGAGFRGAVKNTSLKQGGLGQSNNSLFGNQSKISTQVILNKNQASQQQISGILNKSEKSVVQDHSKQKAQLQSDSVYKNEEEALTDINRLIKLNDFEGVKLRVAQIYKEKAEQDGLLEEMDKQAQMMSEEMDQREQLLGEYQQTMAEAKEEYEGKLSEVNQEKEEQVKSFGEKATSLAEQVQALSEQLQQTYEEKERLKEGNEQFKEEHKAMEKEKGEVEELYLKEKTECDKFRANYEVLKEHELNIIKDYEGRKAKEVQFYEKALNDQTQQMKELSSKDRNLEEQILQLREEIRKLEFDEGKSGQEMVHMSEEIDTLKQKLAKEQEEKQNLMIDMKESMNNYEQKQRQLGLVEDERTKAFSEIEKLHQLVEQMEKTIQEEQNKRRGEQRTKEEGEREIDKLESEKKELEAVISKKDQELEEMVRREEEFHSQLSHVGKINEDMERSLTLIKAKEYDKVDVLKQVAELESKLKYLQVDYESVLKERNSLETANSDLTNQCGEQFQQIQELSQELDYFRSTHETLLDKFDDKIESINKEMTKLKNENITLKEKEKSQKRLVSSLEEEREEARFRLQEAEKRSEEFNAKLFEMEREVKTLFHERDQELKDSALRQSIELKNKEENKKLLLEDIQNLIKEKRKLQQRNATFASTTRYSDLSSSNIN